MKNLVVCFLLCVCVSPSFSETNKKEALSTAIKRLNQSIVDIGNKEASCKEQETTLSTKELSALNLPKDQLITILQYHNLEASVRCSDKETKNYLVSAALVAAMDLTKRKDISDSNELIMSTNVLKLQAEIEYRKLDKNIIDKIHAIDELKRPFNLIDAAKRLGI